MPSNRAFRRTVNTIALFIVVGSVAGLSLAVVYSAPQINILSPYQTTHAQAAISPPSGVYSVTVSANNSNMEFYQGGNASIFVEVSASGWIQVGTGTTYVSYETSGSAVNIVIHTPRYLAYFSSTARIYLPAGSNISSLAGDTSNGNQNVYGPIEAGIISLSTTNGNVAVSGQTSGNISATTVNGNINVVSENLSSCSEDSVNGNLHLTITDPVKQGSFTMSSVNGNQEIHINRMSNATLDASTVNGNIHVTNLPIDTTVSTSRVLQGTINGGGASISMKASNGNLNIYGT